MLSAGQKSLQATRTTSRNRNMARKTIRRSQAVVPFGVGAIFDLPGQSLMSAGLDAWPDKPKCPINDDRLAKRLGVAFFRAPPPAPGEGQVGALLPFVRFPLWHFCPRCRALKQSKWNETAPPRCNSDLGSRFKPKSGEKKQPSCSALPEKKRWRMVPVRMSLPARMDISMTFRGCSGLTENQVKSCVMCKYAIDLNSA